MKNDLSVNNGNATSKALYIVRVKGTRKKTGKS